MLPRGLVTIGDAVLQKYNIELRSRRPITVAEYAAKVLVGMADGYTPEEMAGALYLESVLEGSTSQ